MAKVICLCVCLLSFSFVNCQFGLLTNVADSISHVLRPKRNVEDKVPSCPTVNNMPARCVDLINQCPRLYQVVNTNRNNPKFVNTLKQLQCGLDDNKNSRVCCPLEWIPKVSSATTNRTRRQTFRFTVTAVTEEDTCKSLNSGYLPGRCVILQECPSLYKQAIERSQDPVVRNEMFRIHCGWVDRNPQVCCPLESIATPATTQPTPAPTQPAPAPTQPTPAPTQPAPAPTQPTPATTQSIDEIRQGDVPSQEAGDFVDTLPSPPDCGPLNLASPRVIGGRRASIKMFPWMALLGYRRRWETNWRCGGSLISTRHVLTAAHCIYGEEKKLFQVRLGELDLARDDDGATPIDIPIKRWIIHEQFDPEINENDIGMLTLATDVKHTDIIRPVCLPMRPDLRSRSFEKTMPFLAGWGQVKFGGETATHLQYIQIPVTNTEECNEIYKHDDENFKALDNRSLCAGYKEGKKDACSGDSGGPLTYRYINPKTRSPNFFQIGIISFGKSCGAPGYPGIYVRVTEYIPWIVKLATGNIVP